MEKNNKLSVIIVTWNAAHFIQDCLSSLIKEIKKINNEIIVVDNNSSDKTVNILKKAYPKVILIKNKKNKGFGTANNQGIKISTGNFILLLNPDTIIYPGAIREMLRFLNKERQVGMIGPEQLNSEGRIIFNFSRHTTRGVFEYLIENLVPKSKLASLLKAPYEVKYLNGGCWLIKKEIFQKADLFDESLFLYGEESDMCKRIRKAGWKIFFLRNVAIAHFREGSVKQIGRKKYHHFAESYLKLFKKNFKM